MPVKFWPARVYELATVSSGLISNTREMPIWNVTFSALRLVVVSLWTMEIGTEAGGNKALMTAMYCVVYMCLSYRHYKKDQKIQHGRSTIRLRSRHCQNTLVSRGIVEGLDIETKRKKEKRKRKEEQNISTLVCI